MLTRDAKDRLLGLSSLIKPASLRRRSRLKTTQFTIISNDCWGAEVYKDMSLPFGSPLIGTFVAGPCYMRLISDCSRRLRSPIQFAQESRYAYVRDLKRERGYFPTGTLDDGSLEIQFLHYKTDEEARVKWRKRVERVIDDRLFFKLSGEKDEFTDEDYRTFDKLPLKHKIAFSKEAHHGLESVMQIKDWVDDGKLLYERSLKQFDIVHWLNVE